MDSAFSVLVVEDDSSDYELLRRSLHRSKIFNPVWVQTADSGQNVLASKSFDAVLLDLTLPDSHGVANVKAFANAATMPIVVLSGLDDESTVLDSVQQGAHDLGKGKIDTPLLSRTLRYAIERFRLRKEADESRQLVQREKELRRLGAEDALSTPMDYINRQVRSLAETLGTHGIPPKDVVEVHTWSVSRSVANRPMARARLSNSEARYLLTGLLGYLFSFYLKHSLDPPKAVSLPIDTTSDVMFSD